MKAGKTLFAAVAALVVLVVLPAGAEICARDRVPAATLFFPHVRVDLAACGDSGLNTLLPANNVPPETALAHVTLWSDQAVGVLNFDVYLTGHDVYSIDLAEMLCDGNLEPTGLAVSHHGDLSAAPASFPGCSESAVPGEAPNYVNPAIHPSFRDHLHAWLTGQPSPSLGTCAGTDYGDQVARGFLTVDVSRICSLDFAPDTGYFDQVVAARNVLVGESLYVDPDAGTAAALPALGIEARPGLFEAGKRTFYGRYVGADGSDAREPTPSRFAVRILGTGGASATHWVVYRETPPTAGDSASGWSCDAGPSWAPLGDATVTFFDEEENAVVADLSLAGGSHVYDVASDLASPYTNGWAIVDLAHDGLTVYGDGLAQGWVTALLESPAGGVAAGFDAMPLDDLCEAKPERIFADGFESGHVAAWSAAVP